ncbi:SRPBCC family protein [Cyanobium sp. T1B-Tous]|uniref:SRPBCC family protein n=1 Tax=Cyanobium sp. T1B-Tous TaxID=2823721 RepID=UPI0020CDBFDC|nr:SRPBCC family protein [Cyanobium sp. T1B-Tous]MCP9804997.1 SRPBCC family protein [Cyanobium sp. T1B-Tous]
MVVTHLLQRRSLPITVGLLATLQALPLLAANPASRVTLSGHHGQYTASMLVPVSAPKAWAVLSNYESMAGVMPDIQQAKVVSRSGRSLELAQTYKAPYTFGLSIKARLQVQETPPTQMRYALISGDRIKQLQGSWTITPVKGGVLVKHQIQVVPQIPGFLLGTYYDLTESNLRQSMQILAKQMLKG